MGIKIALTTHKGGSGKTTTSVNLAANFGRKGYKVLLLDMDPQCNATLHAGKKMPNEVEYTMSDVLSTEENIMKDSVSDSRFKNVSMIYGSIELGQVEDQLKEHSMIPNQELKEKLSNIDDMFDITIIDTPPSLKLLTTNALAAADYFLVPVESGSQYNIYGIEHLLRHTSRTREKVNKNLKSLGILLIKHNKRLNSCQIMEDYINKNVGGLIPVAIPDSTVIDQAAMLQLSAYDYKKSSSVSREYAELTKYIEKEIGIKK